MTYLSPIQSEQPMNLLGVMTADFTVYYEVVTALRDRGLAFVSLVAGQDIPLSVGAVITTEAEVARVDHARVILFTSVAETLEAAQRALLGKERFARVVVGIDPGERPGLALLGDGRVLATRQAPNPEAVAGLVEQMLAPVAADLVILRIGHGAPSMRDRIINQLVTLPHALELVDETSTTPALYKTQEERDVTAAKAIALARGTVLKGQREVVPSDGEVRDIQRKSRLLSRGELTISRTLARAVARGELTLDEAVLNQRGGPLTRP